VTPTTIAEGIGLFFVWIIGGVIALAAVGWLLMAICGMLGVLIGQLDWWITLVRELPQRKRPEPHKPEPNREPVDMSAFHKLDREQRK
jgi:hypothetical protein